MAELNVKNLSDEAIDELKKLADDYPEFYSLPVNDGQVTTFFFDPFLMLQAERAIKKGTQKRVEKMICKSLPDWWFNKLVIYPEYDFSEDTIEFNAEIAEDHSAIITWQLKSYFRPMETAQSYFDSSTMYYFLEQSGFDFSENFMGNALDYWQKNFPLDFRTIIIKDLVKTKMS